MSCNGNITSSVYFGESGVGKSTVASLAATLPGLFEANSSSVDFTTHGTWISTAISTEFWANFADTEIYPYGILTSDDVKDALFVPNTIIGPLSANLSGMYNYIDTEGLGMHTEFGNNYDIVTILPHILMAENVFLVVSERLLAGSVDHLISTIVDAAKQTNGTFEFRNGKLFGNLFIVVNKAQDPLESDELVTVKFKTNEGNTNAIKNINDHFSNGPEIILLPSLSSDCIGDDGITYESLRSCLHYEQGDTDGERKRSLIFYFSICQS